MPMGSKLKADEIAAVEEWIKGGAVWPGEGSRGIFICLRDKNSRGKSEEDCGEFHLEKPHCRSHAPAGKPEGASGTRRRYPKNGGETSLSG